MAKARGDCSAPCLRPDTNYHPELLMPRVPAHASGRLNYTISFTGFLHVISAAVAIHCGGMRLSSCQRPDRAWGSQTRPSAGARAARRRRLRQTTSDIPAMPSSMAQAARARRDVVWRRSTSFEAVITTQGGHIWDIVVDNIESGDLSWHGSASHSFS